jgi:organic radical activating enzyme
MDYLVNELFYSLIGEGRNTGLAATFIRLSGCNLNCEWCDTKHDKNWTMDERDIAREVSRHPAKRAVITGGEPLMQDLEPLMLELYGRGIWIALETNGSLPLPQTQFDWVAMSPKNINFRLDVAHKANEIKVVCGPKGWDELAYMVDISKFRAAKLLMPLDKKHDPSPTLFNDTHNAIDYCLEHPEWRFCAQVHKHIGVK